jgi:hypothetical protein
MGLMNLHPATFFTSNIYASVPNPSNFTSDRYTSLIALAVGAGDDPQLKGVVYDLTQVMLDEAFLLPIEETQGAPAGPDVAHSTVKDVAWNSFGMYGFEDVWLDRLTPAAADRASDLSILAVTFANNAAARCASAWIRGEFANSRPIYCRSSNELPPQRSEHRRRLHYSRRGLTNGAAQRRFPERSQP